MFLNYTSTLEMPLEAFNDFKYEMNKKKKRNRFE